MIRGLAGAVVGFLLMYGMLLLLLGYVVTSVHQEESLPFFFVALPTGAFMGYRLARKKGSMNGRSEDGP